MITIPAFALFVALLVAFLVGVFCGLWWFGTYLVYTYPARKALREVCAEYEIQHKQYLRAFHECQEATRIYEERSAFLRSMTAPAVIIHEPPTGPAPPTTYRDPVEPPAPDGPELAPAPPPKKIHE